MKISRWAVTWVPCTRTFACEVLPLAMLYLPHWHTNIVHSFGTIFKSFLFHLLLFVVILNVGVNNSSLCDRQRSPFMSNYEVSMLVPLENLKENSYERRSVTVCWKFVLWPNHVLLSSISYCILEDLRCSLSSFKTVDLIDCIQPASILFLCWTQWKIII